MCLGEERYRRLIVVNYDGQSFYCKSIINEYFNIGSVPFFEAVDVVARPPLNGELIICPCFHIGHGFLQSSYYSADRNANSYFADHFERLGENWRGAHMAALQEIIAISGRSDIVFVDGLTDIGEFGAKVRSYYRAALSDYAPAD